MFDGSQFAGALVPEEDGIGVWIEDYPGVVGDQLAFPDVPSGKGPVLDLDWSVLNVFLQIKLLYSSSRI